MNLQSDANSSLFVFCQLLPAFVIFPIFFLHFWEFAGSATNQYASDAASTLSSDAGKIC